MTPGVPIAHASIQALTHSCIIGGNILVFIAVTKKLTMPVITVATKIPPIMVPTVYLNIIWKENRATLLKASSANEYLKNFRPILENEIPK